VWALLMVGLGVVMLAAPHAVEGAVLLPIASAFSAFFWWWAIGAVLFGGALLTAVLVAAR
jgi:hypothetical protein